MIHHTNSVLIEGCLAGRARVEGPRVSFTLVTRECYQCDNRVVEKKLEIPISAYEGELEYPAKYLKKGTGVRVSGKLEKNETGRICVSAKSVMFDDRLTAKR